MQLSIQEAAAFLNMSPRTVRHLAKTGRLPARRVGNRWILERDALVAWSPEQRENRRERVVELRERVNEALDRVTPAPETGERRKFYSVRDLRSYTLGLEVLAEVQRLEREHSELRPVADSLKSLLRLLTDGCHQFHPHTKIDRFVRARSAACAALSDLLQLQHLEPALPVGTLVDRIEAELLGALRGLLRRAERRGQ